MHFFVNSRPLSAEFYASNPETAAVNAVRGAVLQKNEIFIEIHMDDSPSQKFRFDGPVVRVGRAPECELRLCHEAIPRRLCSLWVDPQDDAVHLEPAPNLSNPLLYRGTQVVGPIHGAPLEVEIGPLRLWASTGGASQHRPTRKKTTGRAWVLAVCVVSLLGAGIYLGRRPDLSAAGEGQELHRALAEDPACERTVATCSDRSRCLEKVRLAMSRAQELEARRWSGERPDGDVLLLHSEACAWLQQLGDPRQADVCHQRDRFAEDLRAKGRELGAEVRTALTAGDRSAAALAALELASLLETCSPDAASVLRRSALEWKGVSK